MTMIPSFIIIQIYLEWLKDSLLIIIMSVKLLLTVLCVINLIHSQQIVDISHLSQFERRQALPQRNYKIDIHPNRNKKDYLQFPTSCELETYLSVTTLVEQNQRILDSEEKQIQRLKTNMTYLLKLAQNIKRAKSFLRQYTFHQEQIEQIDSAQLEYIESIETNLQEKREYIDGLIRNLAQSINKQLNSTKTNGWDNIHLEFQQKIYQSRLNYLLKLRDSLQNGQKPTEKNYDHFFRQIQVEINQQEEQFAGVGEVLGNFSSSNELNLKISTLESQLEGLNLLIKQRQECIQKKDFYSNESRKQLQRTYNQLKELKKKREDPNRQFCEVFAISLLKQLKKLLKVYNYSFACAEGLPDLQNNKVIILLELQRLNKIYKEINYDNKVETIRSYFSKQKELRAKLLEEIHVFKLDQYALNATTVERQISATRSRLAQIAQKLKNPNAGEDTEINYDQIKQIIVTIERQQHAYCVLKSQYQEKYRTVDVTLRSIELKTRLRATHYSTFVAKYNELRQLQREFIFIKNSIAEQLK